MPKDNSKAARARRQQGAAERQAAHDKLTDEQKQKKTFSRPGISGRERARLSGDPQAQARIRRGKNSDPAGLTIFTVK
jgi:hypothetical protein